MKCLYNKPHFTSKHCQKCIRIASTDILNLKSFSGEVPNPPYERGNNPSRALPLLVPSALAERLWRSMAVPLFKTRRRPCSGRIRTLVAMATYSSHRLIMGKVEKKIFCLNVDIWIFFYRNIY